MVRIESIIFTFYQFTLNSGFISLPGRDLVIWETVPTSITYFPPGAHGQNICQFRLPLRFPLSQQ